MLQLVLAYHISGRKAFTKWKDVQDMLKYMTNKQLINLVKKPDTTAEFPLPGYGDYLFKHTLKYFVGLGSRSDGDGPVNDMFVNWLNVCCDEWIDKESPESRAMVEEAGRKFQDGPMKLLGTKWLEGSMGPDKKGKASKKRKVEENQK